MKGLIKMKTFYELYNKLITSALNNNLDEDLSSEEIKDFDSYHVDCLLHPEKHTTVISTADCDCSEEEKANCIRVCMFDALKYDENGNVMISENLCTGCSECIKNCKYNKLTDNTYVLPVIDMLINSKEPVYAIVAPAFIRQFHQEMTQGRLRSVLKKLGFTGMIEVALFADMLTLKEALEFDKSIKTDKDFMLTSCCCPVWIGMIRKSYADLLKHLPTSVSPMIACGRAVKMLYPGAKTVFIGPCIAKKSEAREKDIADAVDYVLTFQEMNDILIAANIKTEDFPEDVRDHSSFAGRIYARSEGVSLAVQTAVDKINPNRTLPLKSYCADGIKDCKDLLDQISQGQIKGNFIEGMGCKGGCVGGPKVILPSSEGKTLVDEYANNATTKTPADNPYVIELLNKMGFETIESLLIDNDVFVRKL